MPYEPEAESPQTKTPSPVATGDVEKASRARGVGASRSKSSSQVPSVSTDPKSSPFTYTGIHTLTLSLKPMQVAHVEQLLTSLSLFV